ncbi:MAG TPA: translation initiation factor IF-2 [Candidatus Paceibacterota bacterium]|nr:translation initiation factor IF-2 [Candidatus Paceibacterota bacterium]
MKKSPENSLERFPAVAQQERPLVVVVMGHVDHGKSTLLDFIRKSNTVAKEAGGITQHVAAYEVVREKDGQQKKITFIDTPGHAAFSAIRARGANVADIAILVVAADDGVKAQTLEALAQIREAGIPFIVAINKIDKPNADLMRTQTSLLEQKVYLEKLGGDIPWVAISAKQGTGIDELLDLILIVAELSEFKADSSLKGEGYVIEAHRDQKRGIAATLIIKNGTLKTGMAVLAGRAIAPVRIMEDHTGKALASATFSSPVALIGFDELPAVGETFHAFTNKREAEAEREKIVAVAPKHSATTTENPEKFYMPVIIRADTTGSLEAIEHETVRVGDESAGISIVLSGIGNISENDVKTALAGKIPGSLIGFNVGIDPVAQTLALQHSVTIETFSIIYKLTERLQELLALARPKRTVEEVAGRARIIKRFSSQKELHVVGGAVTEGYIKKGGIVKIVRRKNLIGEGEILNIQTNKQNIARAEATSEFGAQIEAPFEIAEGDILEHVVTKTL